MWVRIARFEGAEGNWDERIAEVRKRMSGESDEGPPPEVRRVVKRAMMLVDRENGRGMGLQFCETQEDLQTLDEAMNRMHRPPGAGSRSSVEMYEIAVDVEPS